VVDEVVPIENIFELEEIELNTFRGSSVDIGTGRIYGGQLLGQGILAAQGTVDEGRFIHSAHAYFFRAGDHDEPVVYEVDITRDGLRYSSRSVTVIQKGLPICTIMCSFQSKQEGVFDFAQKQVGTFSEDDWVEYDLSTINQKDNQGHFRRSKVFDSAPFTIKTLNETEDNQQTLENYWLKASNKISSDDLQLHQAMFAYCSDYRLLATALRGIGYRFRIPELMMATVCHAIWFHRDFRVDDWFFTQAEPISVSNGRALAKGAIYDVDGLLVATTMQEGVVMKKRDKPKSKSIS